jgi:hypothetical protein
VKPTFIHPPSESRGVGANTDPETPAPASQPHPTFVRNNVNIVDKSGARFIMSFASRYPSGPAMITMPDMAKEKKQFVIYSTDAHRRAFEIYAAAHGLSVPDAFALLVETHLPLQYQMAIAHIEAIKPKPPKPKKPQ